MNQDITFWVFGSGRWAKTIITQLYSIYRPNLEVIIVSSRNKNQLKKEFKAFDLPRLLIRKKIKKRGLCRSRNFAIVCGEVERNIENVRSAISAGLNVYVEKPFTLEIDLAYELILEADINNVQIYCSNVFYFHNKIHRLLFESLSNQLKTKVQKLKFIWIDKNEISDLNAKQKFNPALTISEDILPHLVPLAAQFLQSDNIVFNNLEIKRFGQQVCAYFQFGSRDVEMHLERNGKNRVRQLHLVSDQSIKKIEFADRDPSVHYLANQMDGLLANNLGPLALSLIDFVKSSRSRSKNIYNNLKYSLLTIDLFPLVDQIYLEKCEKAVKDEKYGDYVSFQDVQYLQNELSARLSLDNTHCSYFNRNVGLKLKNQLPSLCLSANTKIEKI